MKWLTKDYEGTVKDNLILFAISLISACSLLVVFV